MDSTKYGYHQMVGGSGSSVAAHIQHIWAPSHTFPWQDVELKPFRVKPAILNHHPTPASEESDMVLLKWFAGIV